MRMNRASSELKRDNTTRRGPRPPTDGRGLGSGWASGRVAARTCGVTAPADQTSGACASSALLPPTPAYSLRRLLLSWVRVKWSAVGGSEHVAGVLPGLPGGGAFLLLPAAMRPQHVLGHRRRRQDTLGHLTLLSSRRSPSRSGGLTALPSRVNQSRGSLSRRVPVHPLARGCFAVRPNQLSPCERGQPAPPHRDRGASDHLLAA